ncbi:hypothetical protein FKM82_018263 [Ascaphus truei]
MWNWVSYLEEEKMPAAPLKLFKEHQSFPQSRNSFKVGMKMEGLCPEHPSLYCVLTAVEVSVTIAFSFCSLYSAISITLTQSRH